MSTLEQPLTAGNNTGEECTFEQRQNTRWYTIFYAILGVMDLTAATFLLVVMIKLDSWDAYSVFVDVMCFLIAGYIFWSAFYAIKWCEIKDLGTKLSVRLGPHATFYGDMASALIPYDDIESYEDPKGCCENCCGLCVAVNPCKCFGGLRGLGMRSSDCSQKIVIITLKAEQSLVYRGRSHKYKRIAVSVDQKNYEDFKQLLQRKCFFDDGSATPQELTI